MMTTGTGMRGGPVDFALMEFPDGRLTGQAAAELLDLRDRGIIHIHHIVVVGTHRDGTPYAAELGESMPDREGSFANPAWVHTDLLANPDMRDAAAVMEPGHVAVLVVYQITWSLPFNTIANESHGQLVASGRLPIDDLLTALAVSGVSDTGI